MQILADFFEARDVRSIVFACAAYIAMFVSYKLIQAEEQHCHSFRMMGIFCYILSEILMITTILRILCILS